MLEATYITPDKRLKYNNQGKALFLRSKISRIPRSGPALAGVPLLYRIAHRANAEKPFVGSTVFNRYYLLGVIGLGGMSVVYRAKDLQEDFNFNQSFVAVKTLNYKWSTDGLTVKRFEREAEMLAMLDHPGIVQMRDFNETENGQPFFVMDYLPGVTLANLIKARGVLSTNEMWNIFSQVFNAVEYAHEHGLVHRDLKPSNIMLTKQAKGRQRVKIVDFGIAKLQQEVQKLTRLGEVWGSPIYMSPEQCTGGQIDHRSDIYSLAVTIFESLSGQLPFFGETYFETMSQKVNAKPRSLRESRPDLDFSEELDGVLKKALEKEPKQRFQSALEFKQALQNAIAGTSTSVRRLKTFEVRVKKPHSREADQIFLDQKLRSSLSNKSNMGIIIGITILVLLSCLIWFDVKNNGNAVRGPGAPSKRGSSRSLKDINKRL